MGDPARVGVWNTPQDNPTGAHASGGFPSTRPVGELLGVVPEAVIVPALALLLTLSARKVWHHGRASSQHSVVTAS